jgi:hypothetical protein
MAKRKKSSRRRSRRVGAVSLGGKKGTGLKLLAVAGGYLLGDTINNAVDKILPKKKNADGTETPNQTIGIAAEVGIGGMLLLRKKQTMLTTIGGGVLAGAGLKRALKTMGVLKGYQSVPVIGRHRMSGYQSVPVIGNTGMPPQLSGRTPAQLQGYRVNGYTTQGSGMGVLAGDNGSGITNTNSSGYMG